MKPSKPYLIGLTGGIACGKSNLSSALQKAGAVVIDADQISRSLTAKDGPALPAIRQRFGDQVFKGPELDREKLAQAVFGRPEALQDLNAILHPMVFEGIQQQIEAHSNELALVIDVPLLYETGFDKACDTVWCAWAPEDEQIKRLQARGMSLEHARLRIKSQMPALEKARRADKVITTTGTKEESAQAVLALWAETLRSIQNV